MACARIEFANGDTALLMLPDGSGKARIKGKHYRWDFSDFCGPTFYRVFNPSAELPEERFVEPVGRRYRRLWERFGLWHKKYKRGRVRYEAARERLMGAEG